MTNSEDLLPTKGEAECVELEVSKSLWDLVLSLSNDNEPSIRDLKVSMRVRACAFHVGNVPWRGLMRMFLDKCGIRTNKGEVKIVRANWMEADRTEEKVGNSCV